MEAATGNVRAMAGGRDYRATQFNRATQARRQPGSVFKPFVFLGALERGATREEPVADTPINLGGWSPGNGEWRSRGEVSLEEALAHSVNTSAVRVLARAGGAREAATVAARFGLEGPFPRDATLALGTGEVTLLDLTTAYAAFANNGLLPRPRGLSSARARGARCRSRLPPRPAPPPPSMRPRCGGCWRRWSPAAPAAPRSRRAVARLPARPERPRISVMPGSWDGRGPLVIGVWLGNDDGSPMLEVRGGTLPARLFRDILEGLGAETRAARAGG
jgi:penicillin-binding protein 1A